MTEAYLAIAVTAAIILVMLSMAAAVFKRRRSPKLNTEKFKARWQDVQALCKDQSTWPLAIINGDKLLDDALRKCRFKGKTMGERLVAAQHSLSDNDAVWFAHKLRNKLVHEDAPPLKKSSVIDALKGLRQALKDLGALK